MFNYFLNPLNVVNTRRQGNRIFQFCTGSDMTEFQNDHECVGLVGCKLYLKIDTIPGVWGVIISGDTDRIKDKIIFLSEKGQISYRGFIPLVFIKG